MNIIEYVLNNEYILNNDKIVGFLHFIGLSMVSLYGFVFEKSILDWIFLIYSCFLVLLWTMYNGECPLIYFIKKKYDKNYRAGDNISEFTDMYFLIGSKEFVDCMVFLFLDIFAFSQYWVLKRNGYPLTLCIAFPLLFSVYICVKLLSNFFAQNEFFFLFNENFRLVFLFVSFLIFGITFFQEKG